MKRCVFMTRTSWVWRLALLLLTLSPLLSFAESADLLMVLSRQGHLKPDQYDHESDCQEGKNAWHDGLWYMRKNWVQPRLLLGGSRDCNATAGTGFLPRQWDNREDWGKQLVTYGNSSVAYSPDGRWAVVSGLALDETEMDPEQPNFLMNMQERARMRAEQEANGIIENPIAQVYPRQYRVLLVDLTRLDDINHAVFPIFDTIKMAGKPLTVDPQIQGVLAGEFPDNPLVTGEAKVLPATYGGGAKFVFKFSNDSQRLYFRVYSINKPDSARIQLYYGTPNSMGQALENYGVHRSFAVDLKYVKSPEIRNRVMFSVMPESPYYFVDTIRDVANKRAARTGEIFISAESGPTTVRGWTLFSRSADGKRMVKSTLTRTETDTNIWGQDYNSKYRQDIQISGCRETVCTNQMRYNVTNVTPLFASGIWWFNDGKSIAVRTGWTQFVLIDLDKVDRESRRTGNLADAGDLEQRLKDIGGLKALDINAMCTLHGLKLEKGGGGLISDEDFDLYIDSAQDPHQRGNQLTFVSGLSPYGLGYVVDLSSYKLRYIEYPGLWERAKKDEEEYSMLEGWATMNVFSPLRIQRMLRTSMAHPYLSADGRYVYFYENEYGFVMAARQDLRNGDKADVENFGTRRVVNPEGVEELQYGWFKRDPKANDMWPTFGIVDFAIMDELRAAPIIPEENIDSELGDVVETSR